MNFDEIIAVHEDWKSELRKYLKRDISYLDPEFIEKDDQCKFGRWLFGEGAIIYSRWKQFNELIIEHAKFHESAAEIVRQINSGNIEKAKELLSFDAELTKHSVSLVNKVRELKDISIHFKVFQDIFYSRNINSLQDILNIFNLSNIEDTIQIIQLQKDDEIFITNLVYYCYIFRLEESIMKLMNHENFPNEILLRVIYYNYGRWILSDRDADEYFINVMLFIKSMKSMDLLLNTNIVKMDLNLTLHLLANLDLTSIDLYFSKLSNLEDTINIFIDLFQNIGSEEMRTFFSRNPDLYGYLIVMMSAYKEKSSIHEFLDKNEKNISLVDQLVFLTNSIKKLYDYEKEKKLTPNERNQSRLLMIINQIKDFNNILEVVNILHSQGIFIDDSEKDIIFNILTDPFLKNHVLNHLSKNKLSNASFINILKN